MQVGRTVNCEKWNSAWTDCDGDDDDDIMSAH